MRRNLNPLVAIVMSFLLYTSENENFQAALAKLVSLKIIWKLKIVQTTWDTCTGILDTLELQLVLATTNIQVNITESSALF